MKRIFFSLLLVSCIPLSIFGITGNGSFGSPYSGPLTSDMTWSGVVYVRGDVTCDQYILTISPGAKIVFLSSGSDIIISGTGVLRAEGLASSMIRFTADFNNNGINGEAGERWGHIVFWNMSPTALSSSLDYNIIEYGDVSGTSNTTTYGGGIFIRSFSLVTINHCIIINNRATHGGGIMALKDGTNPVASPTILNSNISQNTALTSGGGIYLHTGCTSSIINCLISYNTAGSGGGGGVFLDVSANVRVLNSDFLRNSTSNTTRAYNVQFYNISSITDRPRFINCIIWDAANSIHHVNYLPQTNDFVNCAILDISTPASFYSNCIALSATNSDPTGPNFNAIDGTNWSLKYLSPCRDAGTDSYTGVTIPLLDYLGNNRILVTDIGAYEIQYCRWNGSVSDIWGTTSNWDGNVDPNSGSFDVAIPSGLANYPTGDPNAGYVIPLNKSMILYPGAKVTFNSLRNNGNLILQSDATGISSLIINNNVTASVDLFLTGGNPGAPLMKLNKWHYISSPVSSLPVGTFAPVFTQNVVGWYDNQVSGTLATGWVAYDGYRYSTGGFGGPTFSSLVPGFGYDYYAATDQKYTFAGTLNFSDIPIALSFNVNDALHGYNLLGNPFSSGLDWDAIANATYYPFPAGTSKALYFTRDNVPCSYINGVGIPADVTGIIPPMQGFFVKTNSAGNTLTIPAAARVQPNIHSRYKKMMEVIPLVRLALAENTLTDETVIRFDASATKSLDTDFDAEKIFLSGDVLSIYTSFCGLNYAVNGIPFPETIVEIPVVVNLVTTGSHTITSTQLDGLDNYEVTLTDNVTGFIANLKTTPQITFNGNAGTSADRFVLKVGTIATAIEDPIVSNLLFNIYPGNNFINIQTVSDQWDGKSGSVRVIDLTGRTVGMQDNESFSKNSLIQISAPVKKGIYLVELKSGALRHLGKVIIK